MQISLRGAIKRASGAHTLDRAACVCTGPDLFSRLESSRQEDNALEKQKYEASFLRRARFHYTRAYVLPRFPPTTTDGARFYIARKENSDDPTLSGSIRKTLAVIDGLRELSSP